MRRDQGSDGGVCGLEGMGSVSEKWATVSTAEAAASPQVAQLLWRLSMMSHVEQPRVVSLPRRGEQGEPV